MWAEIEGARLYWERHGSGDPLLWITGFTISAEVFRPILPLYDRRFDCILFDNRGAGRSQSRPGLTSMPQLAADAAAVLDHAGVESAHVYGLSMGGMIAQELALRFPHRVRGLILGGTTPGGPLARRPSVAELTALGQEMAGDVPKGRPAMGAALFSERFRREHPHRVLELLAYFRRHPPPAMGVASHWWATVYHDTVSRLPQIQAPTLVVHGEEDAFAPLANAEMLAERIPDAELVIVPEAGHAYPLEKPEESLRIVTDWLDRRGEIPPGTAPSEREERWEPVTRRFGLPIGVLRTGASLARLVGGRR